MACYSIKEAAVFHLMVQVYVEADESIGESFVLYVILKTVGHCWVDRLEKNFAVNVAGVYAITEFLMPALERASPDGRVITVSSGGMYAAPLTEDLQYEHEKKFDGMLAYANNKRVQVSVISWWTHGFDFGYRSYSRDWGRERPTLCWPRNG